jgi:hypothetical protein
MDHVQEYLFGHGDLDRYTIAYIRGLPPINVGFECSRCHKYAVLNLDDMAAKYGEDVTLGALRRRARCQRERCRARNPTILLRSSAMRGDRAWHPRPPGLSR